TRGNNVSAQEDTDANNNDGLRPDGGSDLIFDFAWDPALQPWEATNQEAAIVNLFYWNNVIHDVFYHYGFDEASGNFQENNYGNGGSGGDSVQADAQDGGGINNANFATPPDGQNPRMQMFLWNYTSPQRDGDFENTIIIHEYGHGISNRLVGGPSNVNCLGNDEQMGEGWSDWLALVLTALESEHGASARGIGAYVLGQAPDGLGIRPARYST
ncbi:Peptidase M36, fungalysin, partial [Candidatus Thiomargarita nelsonii]